jgi:LDH2 family malate/lactate/ureidoglycolate dehydrogenase
VLVAGDPEFDIEAERQERGIPLHITQYEAIVATARRRSCQHLRQLPG